MKLSSIFTIITIFFAIKARSQNDNHPTLAEVIVAHKAITSGTTTVNSKQQIKITPEVLIKLKPGDVKRIYLKVLKENLVLNAITYSLDTIPLINNKGIKLFYYDNAYYHLNIPDTLLLGNYNYEIKTEDSNGIQSPSLLKTK